MYYSGPKGVQSGTSEQKSASNPTSVYAAGSLTVFISKIVK